VRKAIHDWLNEIGEQGALTRHNRHIDWHAGIEFDIGDPRKFRRAHFYAGKARLNSFLTTVFAYSTRADHLDASTGSRFFSFVEPVQSTSQCYSHANSTLSNAMQKLIEIDSSLIDALRQL
jgi:hypothetical protein